MKRSVAVAALMVAGCSRPLPKSQAPTEPPAARITQFYASPGRIAKGERALLCYGVENAIKVTLHPPVEQLSPARTRCFEVMPQATTKYTLTATDAQGRSDSQAAAIDVGPPKPHIVEVTINKTEISRGEQVVVCYTAKGATSVTITPGQVADPSSEHGCVTGYPMMTTTYQVLAKGAGGQTDSERVTVTVR